MTCKKFDHMHGFSKVIYPQMENVESDRQTLKKTKPQQTEIAAGASDSVCSGCTVDTDHHQGDDTSR